MLLFLSAQLILMFCIEQKSDNGFSLVILRDITTSTYVEIIPSCGAILHSFNVLQDKQTINVIHSYRNATEFADKAEESGFLGCKLSPFVCRLNNGAYSFGQDDFKIEKFYLGNHALHGLLYNQNFEIIDQRADEQKAMISMRFEYRGSDPGYPFSYDCVVTYELHRNNRLSVITTVVNRDEGLIPIADGWHPYFTFGTDISELQLEFQSDKIVVFDEELIPTGELNDYEEYGSLKLIGDASFDHCFRLNFAECQPVCVLRDPTKKLSIEISPDPSYPYLQIYSPPDRKSIAIENLSAAPDAFNNGIGVKVLNPAESVTFKTAYKITA